MGRLHNVGVITNAAEAGVTQVGGVALNYAAPVVSYAAAVPALHHGVYYGKREADADAYTPYQVATGQTNGGALTFVDAGHGTGHRPIVAAAPVVSYAAAPLHYAAAVPALHHNVYYGKRDAEPYTLGQVAAGQTNGGVITSVVGLPVAPHHAPVAGAVPAATYAYAALPHTYGHLAYNLYGK